MKESFRERGQALAAEFREFVGRYRPETASGDTPPDRPLAAGIGALLSGLYEALGGIPDGQGGDMAGNPAFRRKMLALKVEYEALEALELRARAGKDGRLAEDIADMVLGIRCAELGLAATRLITEALGYYALPMPDEQPGDNEAPLGGVYARRARQGMLARLFGHPGTLDAQRDRLAGRLLGTLAAPVHEQVRLKTGESCAGH